MRKIFTTIIFCVFLSLNTRVIATNQVVNPHQKYTYEEMVTDIKTLADTYPTIITYKVIGKSEYGRDIYAVSLGTGHLTVFINGSHHGREWLTTNLIMYMIDQYAKAFDNQAKMGKLNVQEILSHTTIWFVPMVNPDGVTLQQMGLTAFPKKDRHRLLKMNENKTDFKRWKANAMGYDLNRQYDVDWENIEDSPGRPFWGNFKGYAPQTAAETKAIINFTNKIDPEVAVSYHCAGKILFWNYHRPAVYYRNLHYAKEIGGLTGYPLIKPGPRPAGGGFGDWFVEQYKRPGYTPEIGTFPGETNLPISEFPQAWKENKYVGLRIAQHGHELYLRRILFGLPEQ